MSDFALSRIVGLKSSFDASTIPRKNYKSVDTFVAEPDSRAQCLAIEENAKEFGLTYFGLADRRQGMQFSFFSNPITDRTTGIVHVIGPEQGFTVRHYPVLLTLRIQY